MSDPVAAKLNEIRLREGLGVNEMAHRIGANPGQLSRVLNGKAEITRKMLDRAARVYPELLDAYAASLNIPAKTPHEEPDEARTIDASTQRSTLRTGPTADSNPVVSRMPEDTSTVEAVSGTDRPLPVL
jgi:transcriptional regulator with XRE-family HTH domain